MFYCTAGRGTETFVAQELSSRSIDNNACVTDGKVYFKCDSESFHKLKQLKSVERVFVQIEHCKSSGLDNKGTGRYDLMNGLKEKLIQEERLRQCLQTYRAITESGKERETELNEPLCKKPRLEDDKEDCPSFRVSSKVAGKWRNLFRGRNFQELSQHLGREIVERLGWNVELRNPDMEICVHVNDTTVCAGIPITRQPVSKRDYIVKPGLRSTISWIMGYLANIQAGDIVLDPMCGKATILVEAGMEHKNCQFLGLDLNRDQLKEAGENRESAGLEGCLSTALTDVSYLPLRDACVDKVVCDAPFGQKHSIDMDVTDFYRLLLQQVYRVLRPGGLCVLMTSAELKATVQRLTSRSVSVKSTSQSVIPDLNGPNKLITNASVENQKSDGITVRTALKVTSSATDSKVETDSVRGESESSIDSVTSRSEEKTSEGVLTSDSETLAKTSSQFIKRMDNNVETSLGTETQTGIDETAKVDGSLLAKEVRSGGEAGAGAGAGGDAGASAGADAGGGRGAGGGGGGTQTDKCVPHKQSDTETKERSKDSNLEVNESRSCLTVNSEHYIKLGETHAYIFVLQKDK